MVGMGGRQYTRDELLDHINEKTVELGRAPTLSEMERDEMRPSAYTFKSRFASWELALREALGDDYDTYSRPNVPAKREKLVRDMWTLARRLGRAPTSYEMAREPNMHHSNTYARHYGSWQQAVFEILGPDA